MLHLWFHQELKIKNPNYTHCQLILCPTLVETWHWVQLMWQDACLSFCPAGSTSCLCRPSSCAAPTGLKRVLGRYRLWRDPPHIYIHPPKNIYPLRVLYCGRFRPPYNWLHGRMPMDYALWNKFLKIQYNRYVIFTINQAFKALFLRSCGRLVAGLSPWKPRFDPRPVHVEFVVGKMVLRQGFLGLLRFSLVRIILPMSNTQFIRLLPTLYIIWSINSVFK
jgi:hypothetical protein